MNRFKVFSKVYQTVDDDDQDEDPMCVRIDFGEWIPIEEAGIKEIVKDSQY